MSEMVLRSLFRVSSAHRAESWHSQITITIHPSASSSCLLRMSRCWLFDILLNQNFLLEAGNRFWHECPCQKHPFMKIAMRSRLITMSGVPGRDLTYRRYLMPLRHRNRLTSISGRVSLLRMWLMHLCLCCGVILSAIRKCSDSL